jgi:flagellar basal-body rod protein FlgG
MIRAMFSAATGMIAQQTNIDTIANNLANVNTTGFKKSRINFQDLLYETLKAPGTETSAGTITPEGIQLGHGVRPSSVAKLFTPGSMVQTGNPMDLAIEGDGFFEVLLPDGTSAYTRDGAFRVGDDGTVMTVGGNPLNPGITLPTERGSVTIGEDGIVSVQVPGSTASTNVGTLQIVRFPNPAGLDASMGRNLFTETDASGAATPGTPGSNGLGFLAQGMLENSNVQVVEEIINMIVAQRAYEANSKVIQTADEMLQLANNVRR